MRKIKDVLRLSATGLAQRQIARAVHIGLGSVNAYMNRAAELGLQWDEVQCLDEAALKQRLYPATPTVNMRFVLPDFGHIHQELKGKGVTHTLIADGEGLYDPRCYNDRLLLGLKGQETLRI